MSKRRQKRGELPFAKNLRNLMQERGVSQRKLAQLSGVKTSTLGDWLSGAMPTDLLSVAEVARVLKTDFQILLLGSRPAGDTDEKNINELFEVDDAPEFSGLFLIEAKRLRRRQKGAP